MSALLVVVSAVLALALAGVVYQVAGLARDARRFPPPGQLIDVGGYRLHAVCSGHGTPAVVLESAMAASSLSWVRVQSEVAHFTSVCAYDRAGLAWSDASTGPPTLARVVDDLSAVLAALKYKAPCVLVGHSFGVFVCLAYAARYPHHVSGLVLVDPPSEWARMDRRQVRILQGAVQLSRLGGLLARLGVVRVCLSLLTGGAPAAPRYFVKVFGPTAARTLERLVGEVRKLPQEVHPVIEALWCQPKCFRGMADQLRILEGDIAAAAQLGSPGDVPLIVISSGDQPPEVSASHRALAHTSSRGRHIVASTSSHWVQFDEPELVVKAIREVVDAARSSQASLPTG
jgi:pimeloyl-ACP methyl ester carboxylesterase